MFSQRANLTTIEGRYSVEFGLQDLDSDDWYEFSPLLQLQLESDLLDHNELIIKSRDGEAVKPSVIATKPNGEYSSRITVITSDDEKELGFEIVPWINDRKKKQYLAYTTHVKLLSPRKLELISDIVTDNRDANQIRESIESIYEGPFYRKLFNCSTDARRVLDFPTYLELIERFSSINGRYRDRFNRTTAGFFKNMILGDSQGKYHKIGSFEEYEEKREAFNELDALQEIPIEAPLKFVLHDLEEEERFEEMYEIIEALELVTKRPYLLRDHQLEYVIANSKIENSNLPMSAVSELLIDGNPDNYEEAVEAAKRGADTFEEIATLWQQLLAPALKRSSKEIDFVLGRYIHWKTRAYTEEGEHLFLSQLLFRGASEFSKSTNDLKYAQLSQYNYHLRRGFGLLDSDFPDGAAQEFEKALDVASNADQEWYEKRPDLMVIPLQYKTLAEVSGRSIQYDRGGDSLEFEDEEIESEALEAKLSLISERIRLLQAAFSDTNISVEKAAFRLKVEQYKLLQKQRIQAGQYELAIEAIEETIRLQGENGDEAGVRFAIGLRTKVAALLAERQGRFEEAADRYQEISGIEEFASTHASSQFYRIRAKICQAKVALLDEDFEMASQLLESIESTVSETRYEATDLALLVRLLQDFEEGVRTDIDEVWSKLSDYSQRVDWEISFDYRPAITAILAAQRLKTLGVDRDLLTGFIRIGIAESFSPESSADVASDTGLLDLNIDDAWRNNLPVYTHQSIGNIEIKEKNSITGDYSDIASRLLATLEKYLEVIVEFHGSQYDSEWKQILTGDDEKELTLGDLTQFFLRAEFSELNLGCHSDVKSQLERSIIRGHSLVKIRNELDHGHIDSLPGDEYQDLKAAAMRIFELTAPEAPIIFRPTSKNSFGTNTVYPSELFWSHPQKQTSIQTKNVLEVGKVYLTSPEHGASLRKRDLCSIDGEDIVRANERRVVEAVK